MVIEGKVLYEMLRKCLKEVERGKGSKVEQNIAPRPSKRQRKNDMQMTLYDGHLLEEDALVKGKAIRKKVC